MPVGGVNAYPSLAAATNLFRSLINDDVAGATGTVGEGQVMPDTNPAMLVFLNSAIRDLFDDLENIGSPTLVKDNYLLTAVPVVNGSQGVGAVSPETQVYLSYAGYNDGTAMNGSLKLPIDCVGVEEVWERESGTSDGFMPMRRVASLDPGSQGYVMGTWEDRGDAIWMPGALTVRDLRLRYNATFPDYFGTNIDFTQTFVPILGSLNAIAFKSLALYSIRLAPAQYPVAKQAADDAVSKLKNKIVRRAQPTGAVRLDYLCQP